MSINLFGYTCKNLNMMKSYKTTTGAVVLTASLLSTAGVEAKSVDKPNIIVIFADDISAREFPIYNSSKWTDVKNKSTSDTSMRASTPVMNKMAEEGCWIKTTWGATVSSPSRAQMMTGRYAHIHKWWHNGDTGTYLNENGKEESWPLYGSSPLQLGKIAQMGGYATYWAEKTQMPNEHRADLYGFDEMCVTPGSISNNDLVRYTDFDMIRLGKSYNGMYRVKDSGRELETYHQLSYYWVPGVALVNDPTCEQKNVTVSWPNTAKAQASYGVSTYGPDVAQDHIIDFMNRKNKEGKPFFIYHTTHLGHGAYNFLEPDSSCAYPRTPKVEWDGTKYTRTEPKITGDAGKYEFHNTLSQEGIHNHINYIDYMVWRYMEECKKLGVDKETIFIISADNGTSKYGKGSVERQKGVHIPMIIYAPSLKMKKSGEQDVLMNIGDVLPTVAEIVGVEIPSDYDINGKSLIPFLTTKQKEHRDWIYSYRSGLQLVRGKYVMKDGYGDWYDVSVDADDYDSYALIEDWSSVSDAHRAERKKLERKVLPPFNLYESERNGPGGTAKPSSKKALSAPKKKKK